jgi:hypothetical protein
MRPPDNRGMPPARRERQRAGVLQPLSHGEGHKPNGVVKLNNRSRKSTWD